MKNLTTLTVAIALFLLALMCADLYSLKEQQPKHETMVSVPDDFMQRTE